MTNVTSLTNLTSSDIDGPNWTFTPCFTLFVQLSAILTNGGVLYLFFCDASLWTPFTIYIINLFAANLAYALLFCSVNVVEELYSKWWMGNAACTYRLYMGWLFNAGMCNSHALIALNRLWAVTFPVSYRRYHKKQFAVGVCAVMWVYVNACLVPGIVLDAMWYRLPVERFGCRINTEAQPVWAWTMQIVVFDTAVAFVLLVYPFICYKTFQRTRNPIVPTGQDTGHVNLCLAARTASQAGPGNAERGRAQKIRRRNHGFPSLTLMTLSVLICYTPGKVYFTLLSIFNIIIPHFYPFIFVINALVVVLDPIWFVLAITNLRAAFRRTYCC